jgi:tight adherence protein B
VIAPLACLLAAAAVILAMPSAPGWRLVAIGADDPRRGAGWAQSLKARRIRSRLLQTIIAGAVAAAVVRVTAGRLHLAVLCLSGVGLAWAVSTVVSRGRSRRLRLHRRGQVVWMCDALVAELESGQPPAAAVDAVAQEWPELEAVRDAAKLGGDVPSALRALSERPGGEPMASVAAGWEVASRSGAGLVSVLERLAGVLRTDEDVRREVDANLAAPRATATMLAVLPVFGVALGTALGADPVGVLFGTLPGAVCVAAGSLLAVTGLFWVERIVDRAEV